MPLRLLTIRLRDIFVVPAAVPNEPAHSAPTPTIANALWPGAPSVALADPHQYSNCRERVYREEHPELCPIERAESPTAVPSRGHGGGGGSGGGMQGLPVKVCKLEQCGPLYLWAIPALVGPVSGRTSMLRKPASQTNPRNRYR